VNNTLNLRNYYDLFEKDETEWVLHNFPSKTEKLVLGRTEEPGCEERISVELLLVQEAGLHALEGEVGVDAASLLVARAPNDHTL